jgi:hypothetical protein
VKGSFFLFVLVLVVALFALFAAVDDPTVNLVVGGNVSAERVLVGNLSYGSLNGSAVCVGSGGVLCACGSCP